MVLWTFYGISNWLILLISSVVLLYVYVDRKFKYWKNRGVPSESLGGCMKHIYAFFKKPIHEILLDNYRKHGKIYGMFGGFQPQLSVADPALLKQILVKDFHVFRNRIKMDTGEPLIDNMLSGLTDDKWKRVRCVISPAFCSSRMRKMAYLIKECTEKFAKHCEKAADEHEEIDCKKFYSAFTVDIIASTAFGTKINALENPNHPFVENARKLSSNDGSFFFVIAILIPQMSRLIKLDTLIGGVLEYFKGFAMHVIEEREKKNVRGNDFLQLMLDAQRGQLEKAEEDIKEEEATLPSPSNKTMSMDELLAQCILFFIAGGDASSTTLAVASRYLALYPECQDRLIEEIDRTWENHEEINFDVLSKMPYLDAVICEVLRIEPFAVQLMRIAAEDYELGDTGIKIEKGVVIVVPTYAMHHDPEFFPDPEKFDPERFMPENRRSIPPYVYLPFGEGPRICIGMRLVTMVLKMCLIYLFRAVRMEATEKTKKPLEFYKGQGVLQPKEVVVKMVKRKEVSC